MNSFNRRINHVSTYVYDTTARRPVKLYPMTTSASIKRFAYVITYEIDKDVCVAIDHTGSLFVYKKTDLDTKPFNDVVVVDELSDVYTQGLLYNAVRDSFIFIEKILTGDLFSKIDFVESFPLSDGSSYFNEVNNTHIRGVFRQGAYAVYNGSHNVMIGMSPDSFLIRPAVNDFLEKTALAVPVKVEFQRTAVPLIKSLSRLLLKVRGSKSSILGCIKDITDAFENLYRNRSLGETSVICDVNEPGLIKTYNS